jgi:hypothetical protein
MRVRDVIQCVIRADASRRRWLAPPGATLRQQAISHRRLSDNNVYFN